MQIQNVYAGEPNKPAGNTPEPKTFQGYKVDENGKLQYRWTGLVDRVGIFNDSYLTTAQKEYDAQNKKNSPEKKEEAYSWNPLTWVGNFFSAVYGYTRDMFVSIFQICGYCADKKDDDAAKTEESKTAPQKTEN